MTRIGRIGSVDRVIYRRSSRGVYLSLRLGRMFGVWAAFGPGYVNRVGRRP